MSLLRRRPDRTGSVPPRRMLRQASSTERTRPYSAAKKGPCTACFVYYISSKGVVNSKNPLPPSNNPHDYLSWAPYHWPNCNWCTPASGRTHLAHTANGSSPDNSDNSGSDGTDPEIDGPYSDSDISQAVLIPISNELTFIPTATESSSIQSDIPVGGATLSLLTVLPNTSVGPFSPQTTTMSDGKTRGPAQAAAKPTKTSCSPSPTQSLVPSATWTTCNYLRHDGQVNPDVRELTGPDAINDVAQSVLYNALAYALDKSSKYSKNVATFLETFFLNDSTKMNPNVDYGQIVRGTGESGRTGTFTGILDLRGVVKIINAISIIKALNSPEWTKASDEGLASWFSEYSKWLTSSNIGKEAGSRPNNHGTFYTSQVVSSKLLSGDQKGGILDLQAFCSKTFLDQIAKSGEQPFEAVRTRPFHYRCFNLEALITNAKLGDQLGFDLWSCKSRYGATIQTALDFLMSLNPGSEDKTQLYPHVASIAAAYGDLTGKYAAFLKSGEPSYQSKSYWFYDQTAALPMAPSSIKKARSIMWKRESPPFILEERADNESIPDVPFECPAVFRDAVAVEIDDGIYVTCDQLRSFYGDSA